LSAIASTELEYHQKISIVIKETLARTKLLCFFQIQLAMSQQSDVRFENFKEDPSLPMRKNYELAQV
jgi:hypothetical protein